MRRLRIGILDLVTKSPNPSLYGRVMNANLASIMPQVVGVWCEQEGHDVPVVCYTGMEDLLEELPADLDLVFIGAFTQSAQLAYALSNFFRKRGAVTVLGGPHARCYPEDARKYFDYVLGFTDRNTIAEVCRDCAPHRPLGRHIAAAAAAAGAAHAGGAVEVRGADPGQGAHDQDRADDRQPGLPLHLQLLHRLDGRLPAAQLRSSCATTWSSCSPRSRTRSSAGTTPTSGSGSTTTWRRSRRRCREGRMRHIAESSLSLLSEKHLQRLRKNGFQAILPGIESWYDLGNKSKTRRTGMDKVKQVSEHVNMILRYIPYIQTNFVMGLDGDMGPEPFELTKKFIDLSPGAFPAYSLLSAFGRAAPMNLDYQRAGRVLPFPFHFLNNNHAMNVRPKNYSWPEFYDGPGGRHPLFVLLEGHRPPDSGDADDDPQVDERGAGGVVGGVRADPLSRDHPRAARHRPFGAGLHGGGDGPSYRSSTRRGSGRELGPAYDYLPEGALTHDPNAYLHATTEPGLAARCSSAARWFTDRY